MQATVSDETLSIMRFDTPPCPKCGYVDKQLHVELAGNDETKCGYCGASIPLTDPAWLAWFQEKIKGIKEIDKNGEE